MQLVIGILSCRESCRTSSPRDVREGPFFRGDEAGTKKSGGEKGGRGPRGWVKAKEEEERQRGRRRRAGKEERERGASKPGVP